jgi:hypothetical protein
MSLYVLATSQPLFPSSRGPSKNTSSLTVDDIRQFVDDVGRRTTGHIPVCIDHAGGEVDARGVFRVPPEKEVGRLVEAFALPSGLPLVALEVYHEQAGVARRIKDDIVSGRRPWGVSLGTDIVARADRPEIVSKKITHVGITADPEYGGAEHNGPTWIHIAAETPAAFYRELQAQVLDRYPGTYVATETRARLRDLVPAQAQTESAKPLGPAAGRAAAAPLQPATAPAPTKMADAAAPVPVPSAAAPVPAAAAAAPVPAPAQGGARVTDPGTINALFAAWENEFAGFAQAIRGDPAGDEPVYSGPAFEKCVQLVADVERITGGRDLKDLPPSVTAAYSFLKGYQTNAKEELARTAEGLHQEAVAMAMRTGLDSPADLRAEKMHLANTLFASRKKSLQNAEEFRKKFEAENARYAETLKEVERLKAEQSTRDRDMEQLKLQLSESRARLTIAEKPPAFTPTPTSEALAKAATLPGATAAGAEPPATTKVSVAASHEPSASSWAPIKPTRIVSPLTGNFGGGGDKLEPVLQNHFRYMFKNLETVMQTRQNLH